MMGMLVMSLYNIVDTFWVSGLPEGTTAIAALTVLFPVQAISRAAGMAIGVGVASLVSRRFGEGRVDQVNQAGGHAVSLPLLLGALSAGIVLLFPRPLMRVFGAPPEIISPAVVYLTVVAFGFPFLFFMMSANGLYRGAGNTVMPTVVMACSAGLNVVLDPFLIYGWGPFPRLELLGAALATVISQVVGFAVSLIYLRSGRSGYHIRLSDLRLRIPILRDIAQVAAPASVMHCTRSAIAAVFNWVLGAYGPEAIAAHGLSLRVMMLVISVLGGGVSQGLMPIVGYSFGARDYRRMWRAYRVAAVWTSGGALLIGALVFVTAPQIMSPFTKDPGLARLAVLALRIKIATFFLVEPQMMAVFSLQGMGMGTRAMLLTLTRQVIFVLPGLLLLPARFGVIGAFAAQPAADVLALFITAVCLWRVYRRYPPAESTPAVVAGTQAGADPPGEG